MKTKYRWTLNALVIAAAAAATAFVLFRNGLDTGLGDRPRRADAVKSRRAVSQADVESLEIVYRTVSLVQEHYLDPNRIDMQKMLVSSIRALQDAIPMLICDERDGEILVQVGNHQRAFRTADVTTAWLLTQRFKEIYTFIRKYAQDDDLDFHELQYTAANGMLQVLDPHSAILSPDYFRSMQDRTTGNFGGVGIVISIRNGKLTIIAPIDGTPAQRAGLRAGDIITKIDEVSTENMPINDAVDMMRGTPGTKVVLTIYREGWEHDRNIPITRAVIKVRSVDATRTGDVGYVRIHDFQANTAADLRAHLEKMERPGPLSGLILDLRSNPGGLLQAAVAVADMFLKRGVIVTTAGRRISDRSVERAQDDGDEPSYPIVVLVDAGTASASEIVSGALKQHRRAVIVGERTFGKGSVQVLQQFSDGSAIKLTTAQYLTPGDISIQSVGITPHVEVTRVRVDEKVVDIRRSVQWREGDLKRHFDNLGDTRIERPPVSLFHVLDPKETENDDAEDDEDAPVDDDTTYNFRFREDFEISLAKKMIAALRRAHKTAFDQAVLAPLVRKVEQRENARLLQAFARLGVDWTDGPLPQTPAVAVQTRVVPDPLDAGQSGTLEVTATNNGTAPVYRILGLTRSDVSALNDREIAFGKIAAGQTITRKLPFAIPPQVEAQTSDVRVALQTDGDQTVVLGAARFRVNAAPDPIFALGTHLVDHPGNRDGRPAPGETNRVFVTVTNRGKGGAKKVWVSMQNKSGPQVFLRTGQGRADTLEPGKSAVFPFEFTIKKGYTESEVTFLLQVADSVHRVLTRMRVSWPTGSPLAVTPPDAPSRCAMQADAALFESVDGAVVLRTTAPTAFPVVGTHGSWRLVELPPPALENDAKNPPEGYTAWVRAADCTTTDVPQGDDDQDPPLRAQVNPPPRIHLDDLPQVTRDDRVTIVGEVTDETTVRDVYIYQGDDKRFFRMCASPRCAFTLDTPLKLGINYVTVVAQETSYLQQRHTVVIRRDGPDGMPYVTGYDADGTPEPLGVLPQVADTPHPEASGQ